MPPAGQNVRTLARKRRLYAWGFFIGAIVLVMVPVIALLALSSSVPGWLYPVPWLLGLLAAGKGRYYWQRANHADQGAKAEEDVAVLLTPLTQKGWRVEFGIRDRQVGDIDVFLVSPQGRPYTIDVKSHRGRVYWTGEALMRQRGQTHAPFEKNFLKQANRQAMVMKTRYGFPYVTAMIVFTHAYLDLPPNPIAGVYILSPKDLLDCLQSSR